LTSLLSSYEMLWVTLDDYMPAVNRQPSCRFIPGPLIPDFKSS